MPTLTIPQIAQLATNAGIPGGQPLYTCVAIALAESGGRTDATNANTNGTMDKGVWQINTVHDEKLPGQDRFDPNVNAQLMAQISSNGTNWQPWSTYNSGAYLTHMGAVMGALGGQSFSPNASIGDVGMGAGNGLVVSNASLVTNAQNVGIGFGDAAGAIERFFKLITSAEGWLRIMKVFLGVMLAIMGLVMVFGSSSTGKAVTKTAVKVAAL